MKRGRWSANTAQLIFDVQEKSENMYVNVPNLPRELTRFPIFSVTALLFLFGSKARQGYRAVSCRLGGLSGERVSAGYSSAGLPTLPLALLCSVFTAQLPSCLTNLIFLHFSVPLRVYLSVSVPFQMLLQLLQLHGIKKCGVSQRGSSRQ